MCLLEKLPDIYTLPQFSEAHDQTQKVVSNMQRIVQLLHSMYKVQRIINVQSFCSLTSKNVLSKIRHNKNILRLKTLKKEHWISSPLPCFYKKRVEARA